MPCYGQERYGQESEIIGIETENDYFDIIPETLCQATGKTDKFGDNLFEGDIIQFIHKLGKDTVRETVTVYYSEQSASFMLGVKDCLLPFGMFNVNEGQIIGNIHDDKLSIKELDSVIFDLTDNLGQKNIKEALRILNELLYNKEPIQKILITLYNHLKKIYLTMCKTK